ncbi:MAG: hypothetical protein GY708_15985 [Actinomycetia bacterium]|nr:hypothetical protein [Actinomycetes bacterium]
MSRLDEIGDRDGWRCWLCDEVVDRDMPSSDPRGASIDARITKAKAKKNKRSKAEQPDERLAHVGCNTGKGANEPVVAWPDDLLVIDPAPIIATADRLERKGGREVMARCLTEDDADAAAHWLVDRLSRLHPGLDLNARVDPGGGQYMVSLYR